MAQGDISVPARIAGVYDAYAYEAITVSTTALPCTAAKLVDGNANAQQIYITVESNAINWTIDGTTPTSTVGHNLTAGSSLTITGNRNIVALKMIRSGGADATVKITYSK